MRVISGARKGKKLLSFEGDYIRPTSDRVKEAMFNLIQDRTESSVVLDAFCGSGALGIEALSRGAKSVVCTDIDERSLKIIRKNYEGCGFLEKAEIIKSSACAYLEKSDKQFDIIFLDPPYNKGLITPVLEVVKRRGLLTYSGTVVIERDGYEDSFDSHGYVVEKERKYGRTIITILKPEQKEVQF